VPATGSPLASLTAGPGHRAERPSRSLTRPASFGGGRAMGRNRPVWRHPGSEVSAVGGVCPQRRLGSSPAHSRAPPGLEVGASCLGSGVRKGYVPNGYHIGTHWRALQESPGQPSEFYFS
jgi:hypothetical protein